MPAEQDAAAYRQPLNLDPAPWVTGLRLGGSPYRTENPRGWVGALWQPRPGYAQNQSDYQPTAKGDTQ